MAVETGVGTSGALGGKDFFAQTRLDLSTCATDEESDAALAALLLRYLRHMYDRQIGAWPGSDAHETQRMTCHAAEVLHQLSFDHDTAEMVSHAGNWLINLTEVYQLTSLERQRIRLYPSRFKTLAYLDRFSDEQVRLDFNQLLNQETDGMLSAAGVAAKPALSTDQSGSESDLLRTCIALDTLYTLERQAQRRDLCDDEQYQAIIERLREHLRAWNPTTKPARDSATNGRHPTPTKSSAHLLTPRDLSYVLGLLRHTARRGLTQRQTEAAVLALLDGIARRDRTRFTDMNDVVYPALQLVEHFRADARVSEIVRELLADLRRAYTEVETPRRWDLTSHTLVMRLLLAYYTPATLARGMAARLLADAERHDRVTLESDLQTVIRDQLRVSLGAITALSGGFTDDQILHVPFHFWYPMSRHESDTGAPSAPASAQEGSLIIKRSTSSAFHTATTNYARLPTQLHHLFIRQPSHTEVYKSAHSTAYYLPMQDLTNLVTFRDLFDGLDQRAMAPQQLQIISSATRQITEASFALFRETRALHADFPGTQIARLYLARIESALVRAISRIPWLKTALAGYTVTGHRFRAFDSYVATIIRNARALQPAALGLVHGDFHARNIMLDHQGGSLKLIDLDKLSWSGDYIADLGNLLVDLVIYRRVVEPDREFGLPPERVTFITSRQAEPGTAENAIEYPALGRPATIHFQTQVLEHTARFAAELGDSTWQLRLWLASATGLLFRIGHHTERDVAAVLYGEAIRLLHELARGLEGAHPLPDLLAPDAWPDPTQARPASRAELPEWLQSQATSRRIHEALRAFGLRYEVDRGSVRYHAAQVADGPVAVLVQARREGSVRLVLRTLAAKKLPKTNLELMPSTNPDGSLSGVAILIPAESESAEVLRLVRACLGKA